MLFFFRFCGGVVYDWCHVRSVVVNRANCPLNFCLHGVSMKTDGPRQQDNDNYDQG